MSAAPERQKALRSASGPNWVLETSWAGQRGYLVLSNPPYNDPSSDHVRLIARYCCLPSQRSLGLRSFCRDLIGSTIAPLSEAPTICNLVVLQTFLPLVPISTYVAVLILDSFLLDTRFLDWVVCYLDFHIRLFQLIDRDCGLSDRANSLVISRSRRKMLSQANL